ncbi:basic salivary proline-rich protein 4-like isoform X1 [Cottoperca gobio]|uniref:Basic salivary proline-rich protein 4-like isoform X1 n=1 Tax=Cottoperca gobio TaxID=56716 RepID=A0A6J2QNI2_COTGO|nr:basic salivary proline-rich protein 4-like isoform X1 [Cottoperca gobio]
MSSGFCVRVLVLSLLTLGQQAKALGFRSGGSGGISPHFDFSRSLKPASTSSYERHSQPEGFLGRSVPSYTKGGSAAALSAGGPRSYHVSSGRHVAGYSPKGSVSSYRPVTQPPQNNPYAQGAIQSKTGMWSKLLSGNVFESGIASSYGIKMLSVPQPELESAVPSKRPGYESKPQRPGYESKPQRPGHQSKPEPQPQRPGHQSKPQPQRPGHQSKPQPQRPGHQSKPQPQRPGHQSKPQPHPQGYQSKPQRPGHQSKPQPQPQQPGHQSKPQQPGPQPQQPGHQRYIPMASPDHPRWQQQLPPVYNRHH